MPRYVDKLTPAQRAEVEEARRQWWKNNQLLLLLEIVDQLAPRCQHPEVVRGPDISRGSGSWQTRLCADCECWHKVDHHGRPEDGRVTWNPPEQLAITVLASGVED